MPRPLCLRHHGLTMLLHPRALLRQAMSCWNWKCALMSATARSLVYLAAMSRAGTHNRLSVILVEMAYVTLTAGVYAGMQQKALTFRSRLLGNLVVVVVVPGMAQVLDWLAHRVTGAGATPKAVLAVSIFAAISALFHLHVMRHGVFLSGQGRSLLYDFRRMPGLIAGFLIRPVAFAGSLARMISAESEASL